MESPYDAVLGRNAAFDNGDIAAVLAPEALDAATALLRAAISDDGPDPAAVHQVASLRWRRAQARPGATSGPDLVFCHELFSKLETLAPELVPTRFSTVPAEGAPAEWAVDAATLLEYVQHSGDDRALDWAIRLLRRALATAPQADRWSNLSTALRHRYDRHGNESDLTECVDAAETSLVDIDGHHPDWAACMGNLAVALQTRYERDRMADDLNRAIANLEATIDEDRDPLDAAIRLTNLCLARHDRYLARADPADLGASEEAGRRALHLIGGHPERYSVHSTLGLVLHTKFESTNAPADLTEALQHATAAASAPAEHPSHGRFQANLANTLRTRFEDDGDLDHLTASINAGRSSLASNDPDTTSRLNNLSLALLARFDHFGEIADVNEAITHGELALAGLGPRHTDYGPCATNLARAHQTWFAAHVADRSAEERRGHIDRAVKLATDAVEVTAHTDPSYAGRQANLGISLRYRFEALGAEVDLDAAVAAATAAVGAVGPAHPQRAGWLTNLGNTLRVRYLRREDPADLDASIAAATEAVRLTRPGQADLPRLMSNLGNAHELRYATRGQRRDARTALRLWGAVANSAIAPAGIRVEAARVRARLALAIGQRRLSVRAYTEAISLLPLASWRGLRRASQERTLVRWPQLASDAAAVAIIRHRPRQALTLLEHGRAVLWAQLAAARIDLSELAATEPDLAARMDSIRAELDQ
ncbi:hypothetical protein [Alloactinosynnema sp. L-07]|uniref:hypothetical protein n=1 Tax=Alloactinosynnema sp. L-07 TaxID=1653480 RepID=UPI00065EFF3F|nr:hypothetical protein [Alloactinosynnema sp. L-07]CRK56844.1 hypothetical protein [Alloactinosynnema sp. L-07]